MISIIKVRSSCQAAHAAIKTDPSVTFKSEVFRSLLLNQIKPMFKAGYIQRLK